MEACRFWQKLVHKKYLKEDTCVFLHGQYKLDLENIKKPVNFYRPSITNIQKNET